MPPSSSSNHICLVRMCDALSPPTVCAVLVGLAGHPVVTRGVGQLPGEVARLRGRQGGGGGAAAEGGEWTMQKSCTCWAGKAVGYVPYCAQGAMASTLLGN